MNDTARFLNHAAYWPSRFAMEAQNLVSPTGHIPPESITSFTHEYCHYIQDVTSISSIFGVHLWMIDLVRLTHIFSDGEGKTFKIPMQDLRSGRDFFIRTWGDTKSSNPSLAGLAIIEIKEGFHKTKLLGAEMRQPVQSIHFNAANVPAFEFGLAALQETHAFLAQAIAGKKLPPRTESQIELADMPSLPYRLHEMLFKHFEVSASEETQFVLIDLCLHTVHAARVFLDVLKSARGTKIDFTTGDLPSMVDAEAQKLCCDTDTAFSNVILDLNQWSCDESRRLLGGALEWYIDLTKEAVKKRKADPIYFSRPFISHDLNDLFQLSRDFPTPIIITADGFARHHADDPTIDERFDRAYNAAYSLKAHWGVFNVLTSKNLNDLANHTPCPMIEHCPTKESVGDLYTCKFAPWKINKNRDQVVCHYGGATQTFGLIQNDIEIEV